MGNMHFLDKLNAAPFNMHVSLRELSEKGPKELLQLVVDVIAAISPLHKKLDISHERPELVVELVTSFLQAVNYPQGMEAQAFQQLLLAGDRQLVTTLLQWTLPQPELLAKRAFVGHHLTLPALPEELQYDPEVIELQQELRGLQAEFVEAHRASDQAAAGSKDLPLIKQEIKQLEEEKGQLGSRVAAAIARVARLPDRGAYAELCTSLRRAHDEQVALSQHLQDERHALDRARAAHHAAAVALREVQATSQETSGARLVGSLQDEVARLRQQVCERWPQELGKRQRRLAAVQGALGSGVCTDLDVQRLGGQAYAAQAAVNALLERRSAAEREHAGDKAFTQVRQAAQMAARVAKQREELAVKLERLAKRREQLSADYAQAAAAGGAASAAAVSEVEWAEKSEALKARLPTYQNLKAQLAELEAEARVQAHTLEVLRQQQAAQGGGGMEHEQPMGGDLGENATPAELQACITAAVAAVAEQRTALAPQIQELRHAREQFQQLEGVHAERKAVYDATVGQLELRVSSLEAEVSGMEREVVQGEEQAAALTQRLATLDGHIKRLGSAASADALREKLQREVGQAEATLSELREQQQSLAAQHSFGVAQVDMLGGLLRLLETKAALHKGLAVPSPSPLPGGRLGARQPALSAASLSRSYHAGGANVFVL